MERSTLIATLKDGREGTLWSVNGDDIVIVGETGLESAKVSDIVSTREPRTIQLKLNEAGYKYMGKGRWARN